MKTINEVIEILNKKYPQLKAVSGEQFDGSENSIWFKGTESAYINDAPILDGFEVHSELESLLSELDFFAEPYDSGTLLAYRN